MPLYVRLYSESSVLQLPVLMPNRPEHRLSQAGLRHLGKSHEVGPYDRNGSETTQDVYSLSIPVRLDRPDIKKTSIVAQIVSKIPFYIRQTMEFLRPLVEERFAKMEKLGEKWDDAPVRYFLLS